MGNLLSTGLVGTFACPEAFAEPPQPHLLLFADDHVAGGAERDRWQHRQCDRKLHLPLRVPLWHHVSSACIPWRGKRDTWHWEGLIRESGTTCARGGTVGPYAPVLRGQGGVSRVPTIFLIPFAGALPGPTPLLNIHKPFSCSCTL